MSNQIVFVVDDEAVIAETLAIILNHSGFSASAFEEPFKTILAAKACPPQLLISDVMMPG
jgi:FixJ family two-component response regulator